MVTQLYQLLLQNFNLLLKNTLISHKEVLLHGFRFCLERELFSYCSRLLLINRNRRERLRYRLVSVPNSKPPPAWISSSTMLLKALNKAWSETKTNSTGNDKIESREEGYLIPTWVCKITLPTLCHQGYEQTEKPLKDRGWYLASSPGYSQILSRSCGEKLILRDEIWEWPGEEARWY